jgi:pimeloyl-ACP methyl ester carboxylesterase
MLWRMSRELRAWRHEGARLDVLGHRVFVRRGGAGPHLTLLHGFPTCSYDWSKIWNPLAAERSLLAMDLLGFGDSDKPKRGYSFRDHAERLRTLWRRLGVEQTTLVAHDYSATLACELLASQGEEKTIRSVVLLNGGLRGHLHRARRIQRVLTSPIGPLVARLLNRERFADSFTRIFTNEPSEQELDAFWMSIRTRDGHKRSPALLHYIADRKRYARRWEGALEKTQVPLTFVWGMKDPVSGAHMLDSLRHLGDTVELPVGHYPQWESPDEVRDAILAATRA